MRSLLIVLGVLGSAMAKPKVIFKPLRPGTAIPRDLENEAISEEESLRWLGAMHYKESNLDLGVHLQCDGCWELMTRLDNELRKVDKKKLKSGVREVHDTFCTRMTGYLRMVLDDDDVALPKYGVGKKTAVYGGWPEKYLGKLCRAIFEQHPVEDFMEAMLVITGRKQRIGPTALDICKEKYRCPADSYTRRLSVSKQLKASNYTHFSSTGNNYQLRNMIPNTPPVKMQSDVMTKLRNEYTGTKKDPTDSDLMQHHREVEEERLKKLRHEKLNRAASKKIDREAAIAERLRKKREQAKKKPEEPAMIDISKLKPEDHTDEDPTEN